MTEIEPDRANLLAMAKAAGVLPEEIRDDPETGQMLISPSGARKLAAIGKNRYQATVINKMADTMTRGRFYVVKMDGDDA